MILALPDEFLQELKNKNDIVEVISSYVNLKKAGRLYKGRCPFHHEKTPSFCVYSDTQSFYCFGCHVGGEVIHFIKKAENLDYIDAVKFLAKRAGMDMPKDNIKNNDTAVRQRRIYEINRETAKFFYHSLMSVNGTSALTYLRKRGLTDKTIRHFGLGYAPNSFKLIDYLRSKGFGEEELIQSNVAYVSRNGHLVSRFFDRVMFPILDLRGNVIAFGGRIMGDGKPKYLNTADTPVFSKSRQLFALNFAKNIQGRELILAEGYMDVISLHQAGFENAVATLGTSLTEQQAGLIHRYADEVIICYDSDDAGRTATERAITILRKTGLKVRVLTIPHAKDPDEFMKSYGDKGPVMFKVILEQSAMDIDYRLDKLRNKYNIATTQGKIDYLTQASEIIATSDNPIERNLYISTLSEKFGIEKSSIEERIAGKLKKAKFQQADREINQRKALTLAENDTINPEKKDNLLGANAEEYIIASLMNNPDMCQYIGSNIKTTDFVTAFNKRVFTFVMSRLTDGKSAELLFFSQEFTEQEIAYITAYVSENSAKHFSKSSLNNCINILKKESEQKIRKKPSEMSDDDVGELFSKYSKSKR